jgi:poly-beta-1,6-N-acetyl-D-glucosamine synthase
MWMEIERFIRVTSTGDWILLALFLFSLLVQSGFYLLAYLKLARYKIPSRKNTGKPVTVIICARNEAENLERFLPKVLDQDYPEFEVVVVNDRSTDNTEEVLALLSIEHPRLRFTSIPVNGKSAPGKKLALTVGFKSARFDHLVLTDADCYPVSDQWLKKMASHFSASRKLVLGYGGYERRKGLLNALIRYETVFTALQYLSFAIKGKPYMGVGRNLAYEKKLFFENRGFSTHYHLPSGDDDLFVNETATSKNTTVEFRPESHTLSVPEISFRNWIKQKQRHLTAGNRYSTVSKIRIGTELISRIVLYTSLIILITSSPWNWPVLVAFGVFLIIRLIVFKLGSNRLAEYDLLLPSLLFDPLMPLILLGIWLSNIFVSRYQPWN